MNPVPVEYQSIIKYNREWQAIICLQCNGHTAVRRQHLTRHLRDTHGLNLNDYKPLINALNTSSLPILFFLFYLVPLYSPVGTAYARVIQVLN